MSEADSCPYEQFANIKAQLLTPERIVITAGMPYANGPIHLGHLAGAFVPADIFARWWRLVLGETNVLFVSGSDDHGVTSLIRARQEGESPARYIARIRQWQLSTFQSYQISLNHYGSTSAPEHLEEHTQICHGFMHGLHSHKLLTVRTTQQWFDASVNMFLPDRLVMGRCPMCDHEGAYSQECDYCGAQYAPEQLVEPVSSLSGRAPILKDTRHLWLDMYPLAPVIFHHLTTTGRKQYQKAVLAELLADTAPRLAFYKQGDGSADDYFRRYQLFKESLGKHKQRAAAGGKLILEFTSYAQLRQAEQECDAAGVPYELPISWSGRAVSRDVSWGLPLPQGLGLTAAELQRKTLYVWPESLIAPLSFAAQALQGADTAGQRYQDYWCDPAAERHQFIGIDNVYFYGVMQTALWLAQRADPLELMSTEPAIEGRAGGGVGSKAHELQLSQIHTFFHLQVDGRKMSKSRGEVFTADQMLTSHPSSSDQMRYFLAFLSLKQKPANFDLTLCEQRHDFLAGPMNAALEKPLSAARKHYGACVPAGNLLPKVIRETEKILRITVKMMPQSKYPQFLLAAENYARLINSLFATYKPHDDRFPAAERGDALYSCFFILKNLVILLAPFAPTVMDELRQSLALGPEVYAWSELATPLPAGHAIETRTRTYFAPAAAVMASNLVS